MEPTSLNHLLNYNVTNILNKQHLEKSEVVKLQEFAKQLLEFSPKDSDEKLRLERLKATVSEKLIYDAKVDEFLEKLVECGLHRSYIATKKYSIIERKELRLDKGDIHSLPKEIGNLTKLTSISINNNPLTSLPSEIWNLTNLTKLALGWIKLSSLPREIGNLTNLTDLFLGYNLLSSLPSEIGNLTNLTYLNLGNNQLLSLPPEIGNLSKLADLRLTRNQLTSLPNEIGNLTNLTYLNLGNNQLLSLPPEIGNLSKLTELALSDNQFTSMPSEIGNFTNLTDLDLSYNQLSSLPKEIGNLTNLITIRVYCNQLLSLPREIGNLSKLTELVLGGNQLTSLPSEIGNLTNLSHFLLQNNQLTTLPITMRQLNNLIILDLQSNPLAAVGDETGLGRQELRAHFRNRAVLSDPDVVRMPANTTREEVYQELDKQPLGIARNKFQETKIPEIPETKIKNGEQLLEEFAKVITKLNFYDVNDPGYVSYEELANDFANNNPGDNWEKFTRELIPRLLGYFKTLYDLPLEQDETGGWQMYEDKKVALKKALNFIMVRFNELEDRIQLGSLFTMLVNGLLHCPTGQKEGIDSVILALLENRTDRSINLTAVVNEVLALRKNAFFKIAILTKGAENSQNVHLISTYEGRLKEELGLSNILDYTEHIGTMGTDPFNNNPANVLKVFYDLVTPQRLVNWILEKVPSVEELQLYEKREQIQRQLQNSTPSNVEGLQNMLRRLEAEHAPQVSIDNIKNLIAQQNKGPVVSSGNKDELRKLDADIRKISQFKPISIQMVAEYLFKKEGPNNLTKYFTKDPTEDVTATLNREGALALLTHLGFINIQQS